MGLRIQILNIPLLCFKVKINFLHLILIDYILNFNLSIFKIFLYIEYIVIPLKLLACMNIYELHKYNKF